MLSEKGRLVPHLSVLHPSLVLSTLCLCMFSLYTYIGTTAVDATARLEVGSPGLLTRMSSCVCAVLRCCVLYIVSAVTAVHTCSHI